MDRRDEASDADYEQLRRHLLGPRLEHPAGRQQPREPPRVREPERPAPRLSVMTWLAAVGHAVASRLRKPRSAMARLHPRR